MFQAAFALWLLLPGELPQNTFSVTPAVQAPRLKTVTVPRPAGYHEHQCPTCGFRWGHGGSSFGNANEHTCPNCHRLLPSPWHVAPGIQLPPKRVVVPVSVGSVIRRDCPPGVT